MPLVCIDHWSDNRITATVVPIILVVEVAWIWLLCWLTWLALSFTTGVLTDVGVIGLLKVIANIGPL